PDLIPDKKYFFFSHTIKEQPYNKELLQEILKKRIQLIDYECLTKSNGLRIIGFGRFAGIVGAYNAMRAYGERMGAYELKPAHKCEDRAELDRILEDLSIPSIKIVLTGEGRVGGGAKESMEALGVLQVSKEDYLQKDFDHAVYCQLGVMDYNKANDGTEHEEQHFFENPSEYTSAFEPYARVSDIFIACHFWDPKAPRLFEKSAVTEESFKIEVIADISCDIDGSVPTTLTASTIDEPFYGFDRATGQETEPFLKSSVTIMAVDNLPCELPRDSSEGYGNDLVKDVIPHLLGPDQDGVIQRATIAKDGELGENYQYLRDYVA
ncbi:MAG: alanine dehydrogenase, partial [Bacteroidetes bacterium]